MRAPLCCPCAKMSNRAPEVRHLRRCYLSYPILLLPLLPSGTPPLCLVLPPLRLLRLRPPVVLPLLARSTRPTPSSASARPSHTTCQLRAGRRSAILIPVSRGVLPGQTGEPSSRPAHRCRRPLIPTGAAFPRAAWYLEASQGCSSSRREQPSGSQSCPRRSPREQFQEPGERESAVHPLPTACVRRQRS